MSKNISNPLIPKLLTLTELLHEHSEPPVCVVDRLLPLGGLSILAAHPKAGKSTLIRNLARAVAQGSRFFDRTTRQGKVLYLALEEPIDHVANEFRLMRFSSEIIYLRVGPIPREDLHTTLAQDIAALRPELVIIDPLFDAIAVDDVNSYGVVNRAMKALLAIARASRSHILTVHHTNKSDLRGGLSILGSQALAGSTDCNMFLSMRQEGPRLFESQQRVGDAIPLSTLLFEADTHTVSLQANLEETRIAALKPAMLAALGTETLSTTDWRNKVKGKHSEKAMVINMLLEEGSIQSEVVGRTTMWRMKDGSRK